MKDARSPFYAYRYLVTPISLQGSLFPESTKSKEELMIDLVSSLDENTKTEFTKGDRRFLLYSYQNEGNIFIIKFAKESNQKLYEEGEKDIVVRDIKDAKFVFLIIDTEHQIILVEKNKSVFQHPNTATNIIADFFRENMRRYDYVVNIYPLVSKKKFWNYVENADEIYQLSLELNAPNLFFGNADTRSVLAKIKETTNNETLDISLKNKEGKLIIIRDTIGKYIDYVREVGGTYFIDFKKNGVREKKSSRSDTITTFITRNKKEKYTEKEIKEIKEKIYSIHHLETRDDETDE